MANDARFQLNNHGSIGTVVQGNAVQVSFGDTGSTPGTGKPFVFISHVSEDKVRLRPYLERLMDLGVPLWIDRPEECGFHPRFQVPNRIGFGEDWRRSIDTALDQAGVILVFWSRHAVTGDRPEFSREVRRGIERRVLMQVLLDATAPDGRPLLSKLDPIFSQDQMPVLDDLGRDPMAARLLDATAADLCRQLGIDSRLTTPMATPQVPSIPDAVLRLHGQDRDGVPARLDIITGRETWGHQWVIGRHPTSTDIQLAHPSVSNIHAAVRFDAHRGLQVRDLGSTNGTWVDGHRITADYVTLDQASTLALADVTFELQRGG